LHNLADRRAVRLKKFEPHPSTRISAISSSSPGWKLPSAKACFEILHRLASRDGIRLRLVAQFGGENNYRVKLRVGLISRLIEDGERPFQAPDFFMRLEGVSGCGR